MSLVESSSWGANGSGGVPIAVAGGKLTLKITIKQNEMVPGPKVEVAGFLGTLHLLLSPQQLSMLQEIAEGVAAQGIIMEAPHTGTYMHDHVQWNLRYPHLDYPDP